MPHLTITTGISSDILVETNDLVIVSGVDAIMQNLKIRLRTYIGEWAFDTSVGVDYYGILFIKDPSIPSIEAMIKSVILKTEGILRITGFDFKYNLKLRTSELNLDVDIDPTFIALVDLKMQLNDDQNVYLPLPVADFIWETAS
jgi:hypothetical protein